MPLTPQQRRTLLPVLLGWRTISFNCKLKSLLSPLSYRKHYIKLLARGNSYFLCGKASLPLRALKFPSRTRGTRQQQSKKWPLPLPFLGAGFSTIVKLCENQLVNLYNACKGAELIERWGNEPWTIGRNRGKTSS